MKYFDLVLALASTARSTNINFSGNLRQANHSTAIYSKQQNPNPLTFLEFQNTACFCKSHN